MKANRIAILGFLLSTLLVTLPSAADDLDKAKQIGKIYLGNNQILDAAAPRQLSFRANVSQFEYQPGGEAITFAGAQLNGDILTSFASLVGTQHGTITKLVSDTRNLLQEAQERGEDAQNIAKLETDLQNPLKLQETVQSQSHVSLNGWSADGRYLLIGQDQSVFQPPTVENSSPEEAQATIYTCVDLSTSPPTQRQIPLPLTLQPEMYGIGSQAWWSPKKTMILVEQMADQRAPKPDTPPQIVCSLYDPATRHLSSFVPSPNAHAYGWLDETHILFERYENKTVQYLRRDVVTGQEASTAKPTQFLQKLIQPFPPPDARQNVSPTNPNLVLEEQPASIPDAQNLTTTSSQTLWIRRIQGPKAASILPISLYPLSVSLPYDPSPYEKWSPTGRQVAYLMHGDLFVTDLVIRDASIPEKQALGIELNCDDQKHIATSNLRQISSALMQYVQDNDDHFPPAGDVSRQITPDYLINKSIFTMGKSQFIYLGSGQSLASIGSPTETVIGTMDTPCTHFVIYADGTVKTFDKQENGQSGANSGPCSSFPLPKIKHTTLSASISAPAAHAPVFSHSRASG